MKKPELGSFGRKLIAAGATLACAAAFSGGYVNRSAAQPNELGNQCGKYAFDPNFKNHEYEACVAYTIDGVGFEELGVEFGALAPYYALGNSPNSLKRDFVKHHFETRYWLSARKQIEVKVEPWPDEEYFIDNKIVVSGLSASLTANRAIISTTESWLVGNANRTVYGEKSKRHDSTLCRIKEKGLPHFLHEWVMVANTAQPNFNCNWFAAQVAAGKIK